MKILEAEITEYTTPKINKQIMCWDPITVKMEHTIFNSTMVGKQLKKQVDAFDSVDSEERLEYKFEINSDDWLLEGCWIQEANYISETLIELTIRFDNATEQ